MKLKIEGQRFFLRELRSSDASSITQNVNDIKISRYTTIPYPYKLKDAKDFIKRTHQQIRKKTGYELGIELKQEGQIIGMMSLINIDYKNKNAEVGYWIGKKHWRQGISKEALQLILNFGFNKLGLKRIYAGVMHPNAASVKLLEKTGFVYEGRLRKNTLRKGKWLDDLRYAILKEEYKKPTS